MKFNEFFDLCIGECTNCEKFQTRPWYGGQPNSRLVGTWACYCMIPIEVDGKLLASDRIGFLDMTQIDGIYKAIPDDEMKDYFRNSERYKYWCPHYTERYVRLSNLEQEGEEK